MPMPVIGAEKKKTMRGFKVGRSLEEIIVKRRLDLENPVSWPPSNVPQNAFHRGSNKPASRLELEERDEGYSLIMGGGGYRLADEGRSRHHSAQSNDNDQHDSNQNNQNNQNNQINSNQGGDYNSMANYCQTLRNRVKELEELLLERGGGGLSEEGLVGRDLSVRALNILQQRAPNMTSHPHTPNMTGGTPLLGSQGGGQGQGSGQGQGLPPYPSRGGTREDPRGRDGREDARGSERTRQREGREGGKDSAIVSTIDGIDSKMSDLKSLFRKGDPQERRTKAATKMTSHVRGFLTRCRVSHYQSALMEWRWGRCRHVARVIDLMLAGQSDLDSRIEQKQTVTEARLLRAVFSAWLLVTNEHEEHRNEVREAARIISEGRRAIALRQAFRCLVDGTVGLQVSGGRHGGAAVVSLHHGYLFILQRHLRICTAKVRRESDKQAAKVRRELAVMVRQQLSDKLIKEGHPGVVLEDEFKHTLYRHLVAGLAVTRQTRRMQAVFNAFASVLGNSQWGQKAAAKHWFKASAGKCFYAWSEWNFLVAVGLDRKRWKSARHYEVRYNHKRLGYFSHIRQMKIVFYPWKTRHLLMHAVKVKQRLNLCKFMRVYFEALREVTRAQRKLRWVAVDSWRNYATVMMGKPFYAWSGLAHLARTAVREKTRIAVAYRRWKTRQFHKIILRTWRHQALYGRTDGLYSRAMLAKGLKSQKALSDRLEKLMVAQTVELEECKELIDREILKRFELEGRLQVAMGDIHRQEMFSHHAEQEVKRIEAIVEMMALINPRQVEHLKKMQPSFRFKERIISSAAPVVAPGAPGVAGGLAGVLAIGGGSALSSPAGSAPATGRLTPAASMRDMKAFLMGGEENKPAAQVSPTFGAGGFGIIAEKVPEESAHNVPLVESAKGQVHHAEHAELSKEDRMLLDRAKWLVSRFQPDGPEGEAKVLALKRERERGVGGGGGVGGSDRDMDGDEESEGGASEGWAVDRGLGDDLIPDISHVAESVRNKQRGRERNYSFAGGAELDRLAGAEGRGSSLACNMLLSFVDFLSEGDLTLFSEDDRRLWTRSVLNSVMADKKEEEKETEIEAQSTIVTAAPQPFRSSSGRSGGGTGRGGNGGTGDTDSGDSSLEAVQKENSQSIDSFQTWRQTLIQLRTMFPGGGNYSGVGVPLDPHETMAGFGEGNGMYARLLEMRELQVEVMKTKMFQDSGTKKEETSTIYKPPNLYAGNLEAQLVVAERKRDKWGHAGPMDSLDPDADIGD